ncbi:hypothetical protein A3206_04325 [Candidatus Methanomassiliicoccus intestinalis]|uniref:Putative extracellular nuclease, surface-anchored n=1 Tax=Methanomassiliicoccus intestinalis (strain Issoire-Mx1) TaxID=1295009 RepID=R9T8Y3_METII|nr:InlB B-repeat-containing protein [Candidatus Methanomassiliicoccus intestinalis]AGN27104.1 putative extracellular nuclease, surface-anchored [Candidatus Methanomassiliicoccus intestinalis Issoire-Mx1]TQS80928.1 MAG: hypothetical protein A3206_04325 [Candidatus Methanomassiliicoccus intestinalis]
MIKKLISLLVLLLVGYLLISAGTDTSDTETNDNTLSSSVSTSVLKFPSSDPLGTASISVSDTSASVRVSGDSCLLLQWSISWGDGKSSAATTENGSSKTVGHTYSSTGNYTITVSLEVYAADGGSFIESQGSKSTSVAITQASSEPTLRITSSASKYVEAGSSFSHTFTSNISGVTFSVDLSNASWLSYNPSLKRLSGTAPSISSETSYLLSVTATSPEGQTKSQTLGVFVTVSAPETYSIIFNSNGGTGTISPLSVTYGSDVLLPSEGFTKTGHILAGWNTKSDGTGTNYSLGGSMQLIRSNQTLYAVWELAPLQITLDTDVIISAVDTATGSIDCIDNVFTATAGTVVTLPMLEYKLSDAWIQVNSGWRDAAGNALGFEYTLSADATITPVFTNYFKLTFSDPVVTVVFDSSASKYFTHKINWGDGQQSVVDNISSDQLVHRYTADADYTIVVQSTYLANSVSAQSDVTITNAGGSDVSQYTVSFDTAGGTAIADQVIADGATVIEPVQPSKVGYRFTGWYTDDLLNSKYDFNTKIHADTVIYAGWVDRSCVIVTFNSNGGSELDNLQVEIGTKITKPADPAKDGYSFIGWYLDNDLTVLFDFNTEINENTTLYAKWDETKTSGSSSMMLIILVVVLFAAFAIAKDVKK